MLTTIVDHNDIRLRPMESDGGKPCSQVNDSSRQGAGSLQARGHWLEPNAVHGPKRPVDLAGSLFQVLGSQAEREPELGLESRPGAQIAMIVMVSEGLTSAESSVSSCCSGHSAWRSSRGYSLG
jgi:hypothetical protein